MLNKYKKHIKIITLFSALLITGILLNTLENKKIDLSYYKINSNKISDAIKLVQLSDLHLNEFGEGNKDLLEKVADLNPDLILITGDMINYKNNDYSIVINLCEQLVKIAPVYYSYGNHEYEQFLFEDKAIQSILSDTGIHLLNDKTEEIVINGTKLSICGLSQNEKQFDKYGVSVIDEFLEHDGYRILLTHYPELYFEKLVDKNIDLALSGHAHGGQIRLLNDHGLYSPDQGLFPKLTSGIHKFEYTDLIISRGLGDHTVIPRINNHPEINVIYLFSQSKNNLE